MVNLWHDIDRKDVDEFTVIIECPKGSRVKYEVDKESGMINYDRVLYSPMHYPANYGFVPQSLWEDGDPLDVLVLTEEPIVPGCLIKCRPVGVLDMVDDGKGDAKILAVPVNDPRCNEINDIKDVNPHFLKEVSHFMKVYKDLQNKKVKVGKWRDRESSLKDIKKSFELYDEKFPKKE